MLKKIMVTVLFLSLLGTLAVVPDALAKRGGHPKPVPHCEDFEPNCHPED